MKLDIQMETSSEQMDTGYTHLEFWGIVFPGGWGEKINIKMTVSIVEKEKNYFHSSFLGSQQWLVQQKTD